MSDFREFVDDYYRRFVEILEAFDRAPMAGVLATLERVRDAGGTISVAGNGGSAAIADNVVWILVDNYGIVEDTHQSLIHVITQYLFARGKAADQS